jgi:hypothetical protein
MDPTSIVERDGFLYLYAPRRFKGEKDASSGLLVGRVRGEDIEDPAKYEFFAGVNEKNEPVWVSRVEEAQGAVDGVWGQASVAWNPYLGGFVLAGSSDIFNHDMIRLRKSDTPWGPWEALGVDGTGGDVGLVDVALGHDGFVRVPERPGETTTLVYCTMLHPELDEQGGRVITLTFCRMLKRDWDFASPEGVRMTLRR